MKEEEIRPKEIFDEYLRLAEADTKKYFSDDKLEPVLCPACRNAGSFAFSKHGFTYVECSVCQTLFVNPRPLAECFANYYQESESAKYWASTFYKVTAEARRVKLWRPKARMVLEMIKQFGMDRGSFIDIGGGYGIFAEEFEELSGNKVVVIEPGPALAAVCRSKGLEVIQGFLEDIRPEQLSSGKKTFFSFELFEHLHDPEKFLSHLHGLMAREDLFVFTTLSGTGVDIQALWEDSKSVSPPHHLNFLNPGSVRVLLERLGFGILQVSTPGQLDIDILCNNKEFIKDRFWKTFALQATEEEKHAMQVCISNSRLSSHMLVACQKI